MFIAACDQQGLPGILRWWASIPVKFLTELGYPENKISALRDRGVI